MSRCSHLGIAAGHAFDVCLNCGSWRVSGYRRWWPAHYPLPWSPPIEDEPSLLEGLMEGVA